MLSATSPRLGISFSSDNTQDIDEEEIESYLFVFFFLALQVD
jgi:hypothetical protein